MGWNNVDKEMTNALNEFFKEQAKLDGKCLVDYVQFDSHYEMEYEARPIAYAEAYINPRGGTALVDAIGRGTVELGRRLKAMKEGQRPGKVMVVVVTDGGENSSREFTADQVREMVTEQQDRYNWDYVFLGANMDAVSTGTSYGFKGTKSMTFDTQYTGQTVASLNAYATTYRGAAGAAAAETEFSEEDRKSAVGS